MYHVRATTSAAPSVLHCKSVVSAYRLHKPGAAATAVAYGACMRWTTLLQCSMLSAAHVGAPT